ERLEQVDTRVIDKTGTLTEGKPKVVDVIAVAGSDRDELLRVAASVERASEHPLARAILEAAQQRGLTLSDAGSFTALAGKGVTASVHGRPVALGNILLM